ncbi:MAG TPA: hypothetical protein VNK24_02325 [Elusimicrobiota bacterium]|nr:hypothetical protein [Elusimicrobiota bacterium]
MNPKTPFFKGRSSGGISSAFRKKEARISAAILAAAALAAAFLFGGKAFSAFRIFSSAAAAAPNASLPVSAQARGVPQLPHAAQPANPESLALIGQYPKGVNGRHWRGDLAGQTVTGLIDPSQAGRRLPSVALPMSLPPGLSAAAPDAVAQALGATSVPRPPRTAVKGRFRGRWFSRRYKLGALAPCSGVECAFRKLSDVRVLTADHDPCLAIKGCVVENAVADENAVYDGSPAAPSLGAASLNQAAPEIKTGAQAGLGGQSDASASEQAQVLSRDAQRCAAADALYFGTSEKPGPQVVAQQDFSRAYEGLERSGCLSASGSLCAAPRDKAGELCRQFDAVRLAHYEACPIDRRMGPYEPAQCVL